MLSRTALNGHRYCDLVPSSADATCVKEASAQPFLAQEMNRTCHCYPECDEHEYHILQSAVHWPSDNYWAHLAERYGIKYANETIEEEELQKAELEFYLNGTEFSPATGERMEKVRDELLVNVSWINYCQFVMQKF